MNTNKLLSLRRLFSTAFLVVAAMMLSGLLAKANPYASTFSNSGGTITFFLNEAGGDVTVIYEDGSTNANFDPVNLGTGLAQAAGSHSFALGIHTGFEVIVNKLGNGVPVLISTDNAANTSTAPFTWWPTPRGIDVYKSPTNGTLFGRVYIGNDANSAFRQYGISVLTPDLNQIVQVGAYTTNIPGGQFVGAFAADAFFGNTSTPWHMHFGANDNMLYVACNGTSGGTVLQFAPDFSTTNVVLGPFGQANGVLAQTHADPEDVITTGSLATGDLKVYTYDPDLGAPDPIGFTDPYPPIANTSHPALGVGGPLNVGAYGPTISGDYNMLLRYDIGAGEAVHYNLVNVWTNNGGTGYAVNDLLTNVGGVCAASNHINLGNTQAVVKVTGIGAGGSISIVQVQIAGDYTTPPSGPVSVTGGAGSGATLNVWYPQILWSAKPNFATGVGLPGFPDSQIGNIAIGPTGLIFGGMRRSNQSDGTVQGFDPSLPNTPRVYDSLKRQPSGALSDNFVGITAGEGGSSVAFSPDGQYIAVQGIDNDISVGLLTNGVPDDASIFIITNLVSTVSSRGLAWDAAGNIYGISSGQAELRVYSLGNSSTCISSNTATLDGGAFKLILPAVHTTMSVPTATASQNYINSVPAGTPIPGVFRIALNVPTLAAPLTVNFTLTGTAIAGTHYTLPSGPDVSGIVVTSTGVTFPAGTAPSGNWFKDITITPTATPLFTNTLGVTVVMGTSANYIRNAPVLANISILNTGPQVLLLTPGTGYTSMYRGTTNDYAQFVITRLGDLNGPGNDSTHSVVARNLTITNFDLLGTAVLPTNGAVNPDYTAGPQVWNPTGTPTDGSSFSVVVSPGVGVMTNVVGNPQYHGDIYTPPVNATVIVSLTNKVSPVGTDFTGVTNSISQEGFAYAEILANSASLSILDNRLGPEVVLYSNPLTNAADSVNWTLTWNGTNNVVSGNTNSLPFVTANYPNNVPYDGTHDYNVNFGFDRTTEPDGAIPASPIMTASNWNNVLRVTVNKNGAVSPSAVNLYPHQTFGGNYALRFNMYLSMDINSVNNPFVGNANREFAMFGMNHLGTNCNWRIASPINNRPNNGGNDRTNQDGVWFTVDAGTGSQTPADFDGFQGRPVPNQGWSVADTVSSLASVFKGTFKSPPFPAEIPFSFDPSQVGGQPVDQWVDVSMEIRSLSPSSNAVSLIMNKTTIFNNMILTNVYTNGAIMLGYLDPVRNPGDPFSAYVYYSNVRAVELQPYITLQSRTTGSGPGGQTNFLVSQFSSLVFTSSATYASAPMTNKWFRGTGNYQTPNVFGVPTALLQSNSVNATTFNDQFTNFFNDRLSGTNFMNVYSDAAGSVTSRVVAVEVVLGPTNRPAFSGANSNLFINPVGPSFPTAFQWYFNSASNFAGATRLVGGAKYGNTAGIGPTTTNLWITNITSGDVGYYWCAVTNSAITNGAAFNFTVPEAAQIGILPTGLAVTPSPQSDLWGSNATFTVSATAGGPFTYVWKKGAAVLADSLHIGGSTSSQLTITNITFADAGTYTAAVTNTFGGATANGVLVEVTTPPHVTSVIANGITLTVSFASTNYDNANTTTFTLQASPFVKDVNDLSLPAVVWTNVPGTYSSPTPGNYQISAPQDPTAGQLFYRVIHN